MPAGAAADDADADAEDFFGDKLDDVGLVRCLVTDQTLTDVVQAMRYARGRMFSPVPTRAAGMSSTRTAELLSYRAAMPPLVTVSHLQALLASPTAVERQAAALTRSGVVRKMTVQRRGAIGEALVETSDLEEMVRRSGQLDEEAKAQFLRFLRENPAAQTVPALEHGRPLLSTRTTDQLVRDGFLTSGAQRGFGGSSTATSSLATRPEDRATLASLEHVSKAASGSLRAVGGPGAVHRAGGGGGAPTLSREGLVGGGGGYGEDSDLGLAVPGNGVFLKLVSAALEHLLALLARSQFREMPETLLREKWDGNLGPDEPRRRATTTSSSGKVEFMGVVAGRTRKWKEFYGLSFEWILEEAVGSGLVEVFETGTVGRGVRGV